MKYTILCLLAFVTFCSCQNTKIGYLIAENAEYVPAESRIPKEVPNTPENATRIENNAPWISSQIQGVMGTEPIRYAIAEVTASAGGDAAIFKSELNIRGMGLMEVPLRPAAPIGTYVVSVKIYNEDHSYVLKDAYTFIIY